MQDSNWIARLDDPFYRDFDYELERAGIPRNTIHQVLDRLEAPGRESHNLSAGERLRALAQRQFTQDAHRARIGCNYVSWPRWKFLTAIPLIYVPIVVGLLPLVATAILVRAHLCFVGGHELKSYWEFVPSWVSHRYTLATQVRPVGVFERFGPLTLFARSKLFWIVNCKLYCPLSVSLLAYVLYMVKIVEQWWCPFAHDRKGSYADAPIDESFWHASGDAALLHPEDRHNRSWSPPQS